jgi:uncharacterized protein YjbI with pentapeptide repeats
VDSSVVGYDGARNVRDEERRVKAGSGTSWLVGITLLAFVGGLIIYSYADWSGAQYFGIADKKFWDYLELLIVPAALAFGVYWLNRRQTERDQQAEDAQHERALAVESQRAQDEALQAYLNQMSDLMLKYDLRKAKADNEVRTLARARTLTVLEALDASRKTSVVRFLGEANLIQKEDKKEGANEEHETSRPVISLRGADLRGANLSSSLNLCGAELSFANLRGVYMSWIYVSGVYLRGGVPLSVSDLREVDLREVEWERVGRRLVGPILADAILYFADLSQANLRGAGLSGAVLRGANLSGADLSMASVTQEQLDQVMSLSGATMPNGQKYEDWLKDREAPAG